HDEDDLTRGEVRRAVDDLRAELGQRLCLGPGPVPGGYVVAGPQQAQDELVSHSPRTDPANGGRGGGHACLLGWVGSVGSMVQSFATLPISKANVKWRTPVSSRACLRARLIRRCQGACSAQGGCAGCA